MKTIPKLILSGLLLLSLNLLLSNCTSEEDTEDSQEEALYEEEEESNEDEDEDFALEEDEEEEEEEEASETLNSNWDEALDDYEEFVDEYIVLLKKASKGDNSALAEYPSVLQKAQDSSKKLGEAKGNLSPEQWQRFMAIQQKLTKAASEIQ